MKMNVIKILLASFDNTYYIYVYKISVQVMKIEKPKYATLFFFRNSQGFSIYAHVQYTM